MSVCLPLDLMLEAYETVSWDWHALECIFNCLKLDTVVSRSKMIGCFIFLICLISRFIGFSGVGIDGMTIFLFFFVKKSSMYCSGGTKLFLLLIKSFSDFFNSTSIS